MSTIINRLPFTVSLLFIFLCCYSAQAQSQKDIVGFVNGVMADLNRSSIKVPAFESARAQSAQKIKQANDIGYYLCKLRNKEGPAGYVAVAAKADAYQVIALSATDASPEYFLEQLDVRNLGKQPLRFSQAKLVSFIKGVPLVASAKTKLGFEPIEITEIASSLSSLLNYMQYDKKMLLFGHIGLFRMDSDYSRLYRMSERPKESNWKSLEEENREIEAKMNIPEKMTSEQKGYYMVKHYNNVIRPIIRRRLLNPTNPWDRLDVLQKEVLAMENISMITNSRGMRDATTLQLDYLDTNVVNLKRNTELFFETRGLTADIQIVPVANVPADSLPVVLLGPNDTAGVALGFMNIDGERFVVIFFPKTGRPKIMSLAEKSRVDPNEGKNARVREALLRLKKSMEQTLVAEDVRSIAPNSLDMGIHLCRISSLEQWQAVVIGKITLTGNWGNYKKP